MKPIASYCILCILSLSLLGCCGRKADGILKEKEAERLTGEIICDSVPLGAPQSITLIGRTLYVVDKHDGCLMTAIPIDNPANYTRIVRVGNGPGEYMRLSGISVREDGRRIILNDDMKRVLVSYAPSEPMFDPGSVVGELSFRGNENLYAVLPLGEGLLAAGCFEENLFSCFDTEMKTVSRFGVWPGDRSGIGSQEFMMRNQSVLAMDPSETHFVAAGMFSDWIAFYDREEDGFRLRKEYFFGDADMEVISHKAGGTTAYSVQENEPTVRTYRALYAGNQDAYALYWGVRSEELDEPGQASHIIRFSYDGAVKAIYRVDGLIRSFAVDEQGKVIYALTFSRTEAEHLMKLTVK